jgi:hypothetical protein
VILRLFLGPRARGRGWGGAGVVVGSLGGLGVVGLGGCTFSRRVLPSSCPWPRRPVAKMTSRPSPWWGVVGWGGGGAGGRLVASCGFVTGVGGHSDFSRQVFSTSSYPQAAQNLTKSCPQGLAARFFGVRLAWGG